MKSIQLLAITCCILCFSCKKDETPPEENIPNEEELITTVILTFTPDGGGDAIVWRFTDLDGDGGDAPVIDTDTLGTSTTYNLSLNLLNESEDPAENITEEIEEEAVEHQFFFEVTGVDLAIDYDDTDADGNPIGLMNIVTTGAASSGDVQVTLRHQPDKSADGVEAGNINNAGGETDIEVLFDAVVD